jgi:hypothetical protein
MNTTRFKYEYSSVIVSDGNISDNDFKIIVKYEAYYREFIEDEFIY